jgi:hypothetical protein
VSGGEQNTASGFRSSVCAGFGNTVSGARSSVNGGQQNTAGAALSTVGGEVQEIIGTLPADEYDWRAAGTLFMDAPPPEG